MLTQLIYSSRASRILNNTDLSSIISSSQRNNALVDITGAMCYANGTFLQCLEGDSLAVSHLYEHITRDERHTELKILNVNPITERLFPTWSMEFYSGENDIGQLFLKHGRMAEFNPFHHDFF